MRRSKNQYSNSPGRDLKGAFSNRFIDFWPQQHFSFLISCFHFIKSMEIWPKTSSQCFCKATCDSMYRWWLFGNSKIIHQLAWIVGVWKWNEFWISANWIKVPNVNLIWFPPKISALAPSEIASCGVLAHIMLDRRLFQNLPIYRKPVIILGSMGLLEDHVKGRRLAAIEFRQRNVLNVWRRCIYNNLCLNQTPIACFHFEFVPFSKMRTVSFEQVTILTLQTNKNTEIW